jgi:hypothetical protein
LRVTNVTIYCFNKIHVSRIRLLRSLISLKHYYKRRSAARHFLGLVFGCFVLVCEFRCEREYAVIRPNAHKDLSLNETTHLISSGLAKDRLSFFDASFVYLKLLQRVSYPVVID